MTTLRDDLKTLMAEIPITHEEIRQFKENLRPGRMIYSAEPVEYIDKLLETFITNKSPETRPNYMIQPLQNIINDISQNHPDYQLLIKQLHNR